MPFKVKFQIFEPGKLAPCFTTHDASLAHAEYRHQCNQKGCALTRMTTDIECIDLTKPEQYVFLVYRVRKAISRFYNGGRKPEDLQASLELERQLDEWNGRTRLQLQAHPGLSPVACGMPADSERARHFAFFLLVDKWRDKWHRYFNYKRQHDRDGQVVREMYKECIDYEKQIDNFIKQVIGL